VKGYVTTVLRNHRSNTRLKEFFDFRNGFVVPLAVIGNCLWRAFIHHLGANGKLFRDHAKK
jgi:hypothetical protein